MKNISDYDYQYLKKDILLLANVFKIFISTYLKFYKLDPCHYFSSPGLNWDAKLGRWIKFSLFKVDQNQFIFLVVTIFFYILELY